MLINSHKVVLLLLCLEGVSKKFGAVTAVEDVSLQLESGEIFGFLGPNGAGKTTTVRMSVGLLRPDTGRVLVGEYDMTHQPRQAKAQLGYVPDRSMLYPKMTGREHLQFLSLAYQLPAPHGPRIDRWLDIMSLSDAADSRIETYSHGMARRLTWISALIHDPPLLFLDEPTEGLDPASARTAKDLLVHLRERGRSVFLCTHIMELAQSLCDRVGIIADGRLLAVGSPEGLGQMSARGSESLEDVFLELTDSQPPEISSVVDALSGGGEDE